MPQLSDRLQRLKKRLHEKEFKTVDDWWFADINILDLPEYAELRNAPIPVRKAYSLQYVAKKIPLIIKADEIIVGCPNQNSVEFGMSIPKYLTARERDYFEHYGLSEQSLPAHHPPAWDTILREGVTGVKSNILKHMEAACPTDKNYTRKIDEWQAMLIALDALIIYARRYAEKLKELIDTEKSPQRKRDYQKMWQVCCNIPQKPAITMHEAVQSYWFLYTILNSGGEFLPLGRLDQYFYPYYHHDLANGLATREELQDILGSFLVKCNERVVFKTKEMVCHRSIGFTNDRWHTLDDAGVALEKARQTNHKWHYDEPADSENNKFFGQETNNKMMTAVVGGVNRDGADASNEVSEILLSLMVDMELLFPTFGVRLHMKTPAVFLQNVAAILQHGQGEPIIYNDDTILEGYKRLHITMQDARDYSSDGCWETVIPGKTNFTYYTVSALDCLEFTMNQGYRVKSGVRESLDTGSLDNFVDYESFYNAFIRHMNSMMEDFYGQCLKNLGVSCLVAPDPLFSALSSSCVARGEDFYGDGAQYQSRMLLLAGLANTVNSLAVIKKLVYDDKKVSLPELNKALLANWQGYERLQAMAVNRVPKYGNDDDYADNIAIRLLHDYAMKIAELRSLSERIELLGGIGTFHVYAALGNNTAASADGRYAYDALAPNYSPVPGTDLKGPLAAILSSTKPDLEEFMSGTPIDISVNKNDFTGAIGRERLLTIIETFCHLGGQILTITATSVEELQEAKVNPDKYRSLRIRMGGLSAYFVTLASVQQDKIIARFM